MNILILNLAIVTFFYFKISVKLQSRYSIFRSKQNFPSRSSRGKRRRQKSRVNDGKGGKAWENGQAAER